MWALSVRRYSTQWSIAYFCAALEYWLESQVPGLDQMLPRVLPRLVDYLTVSVDANLRYELQSDEQHLRSLAHLAHSSRATQTKRGSLKGSKQSVTVQLQKAQSAIQSQESQAEARGEMSGSFSAEDLRHRMLRLLGRLGGHTRVMVDSRRLLEESPVGTFVAFDSSKRLNLSIPFLDLKPVIALGTLQ